MTIEAAGLVEEIRRSDRVGLVDKVIKKKRCPRKVVRIRLRRCPQVDHPTTLQKLFRSCRNVFKGPGTVPSPTDVRKLCRILDVMKPEDVGLSRDLQFFKPRSHEVEGTPRVTSATIYKCENFELCIFFLPATAVIPLHNHPEMTVFSKLLLGTMHIKAYDWVDSLDSDYLTSPSKSRLAKLKADATFTAPCDTSVLYPTSGGNIHEFTAITPCAVLDVIGPPYSKDDGRDCSHYRDTPCNASLYDEEVRKIIDNAGGRYAWLEEIEIPEESEMDGIEYKGPQVFDSMA
ncbi:Plant cysteine oxidase 1 [Sesamum angolense]|uniref:cysteine dioxygenase n=1 Tax=Sesamum angolense TaxID=2727404 RepID=A0AAE2BT17_9LAMI|nr:Plant cysteine oxidase 1 [Sesamum angolense]